MFTAHDAIASPAFPVLIDGAHEFRYAPLPRNDRNEIDKSLREIFGARLRRLLTERGMTQAALGRQADVARQIINNYATGSNLPSGATLQAIANALRVPVSYFFPAEELSKLGISTAYIEGTYIDRSTAGRPAKRLKPSLRNVSRLEISDVEGATGRPAEFKEINLSAVLPAEIVSQILRLVYLPELDDAQHEQS